MVGVCKATGAMYAINYRLTVNTLCPLQTMEMTWCMYDMQDDLMQTVVPPSGCRRKGLFWDMDMPKRSNPPDCSPRL